MCGGGLEDSFCWLVLLFFFSVGGLYCTCKEIVNKYYTVVHLAYVYMYMYVPVIVHVHVQKHVHVHVYANVNAQSYIHVSTHDVNW